MAYPDKINALVDVTADQTLAAGGHAARHNDVNEALEEVRDVLGGGTPITATATYALRIQRENTLAIGLQRFDSSGGPSTFQTDYARGSIASPAVVQDNDRLGLLDFRGYSGAASNFVTAARIEAQVDGTPDSGGDTTDMPGRLLFQTTADGAGGATERMRITNAGAVLIGTTSAGSAGAGDLVVNGFLGVGTDPIGGALNPNISLPMNGRIETDGGTLFCSSIANSTTAAGANTYVDAGAGFMQRSTSSIRFKTDIEPLEDEYADKVLQLKPVWYRSTCEMDVERHPDWSYYGLIAEQVAQVEPRAVFWGANDDGDLQPEGVQYDRLVPHLISVVKRQQAQIDELTARLDAAGL